MLGDVDRHLQRRFDGEAVEDVGRRRALVSEGLRADEVIIELRRAGGEMFDGAGGPRHRKSEEAGEEKLPRERRARLHASYIRRGWGARPRLELDVAGGGTAFSGLRVCSTE